MTGQRCESHFAKIAVAHTRGVQPQSASRRDDTKRRERYGSTANDVAEEIDIPHSSRIETERNTCTHGVLSPDPVIQSKQPQSHKIIEVDVWQSKANERVSQFHPITSLAWFFGKPTCIIMVSPNSFSSPSSVLTNPIY
ncbi:hypothetical protein FI667_g11861, partial [Globisporangium splendens]